MAKILILGGNGMIGHQLFKSYNSKYTVMTTLRNKESYYDKLKIFNKKNSFFEVNILDFQSLETTIKNFEPNFIINAIGITKQKVDKVDKDECVAVNTHFPHELAKLCKNNNIKLIHLSTDCVFSGIKGNYNESDPTDCNDLYGKSKAGGEVTNNQNVLTIRKSTIGFEIHQNHGLLEWFLSQKGDIHGYKNAIFSGVTTLELSRIIENIFLKYRDIYGLWHVSGEPINKYDLLLKIKKFFKMPDVNIIIDHNIVYDRTLDGNKFLKHTNYIVPDWNQMINDLYTNSFLDRDSNV